jgi:hypothetical protein
VVAPAHACAVRIAARRSSSNGLPAPPSHQLRLAEPAMARLLVLVIAIGPCAGEEEQKTTTGVVVDVHIAHLAGCSPAGIGTRRRNAGCRASKGRFPPPLWMSAGLHSLVAGDDSRRARSLSSVSDSASTVEVAGQLVCCATLSAIQLPIMVVYILCVAQRD